uniref:CysZ protein n=1 Tax=Cyanothece sp. (strain PCC 7425 / ATCC 29141) TaxID=395961 RepID=B8HNA8_CYAP4
MVQYRQQKAYPQPHPLLRLAIGFGAFFRGFLFVKKHKLWPYLLLPSLLSAVLGVLLLIGIYAGTDYLVLRFWDGASGIWQGIYESLVQVVALVAALFITFFTYQLLASVLVIPFLGPLLAEVELRLTGEPIATAPWQDFKNAWIGIWMGIRDLCLQLLCLVISLFLGPFQPAFMIAVTSHFLGRASFDFLLEKHTKNLPERHAQTRAYLLEMEGLGLAQFMILLVPLLGVFIAPASALVGAALVFYADTNSPEKLPCSETNG